MIEATTSRRRLGVRLRVRLRGAPMSFLAYLETVGLRRGPCEGHYVPQNAVPCGR